MNFKTKIRDYIGSTTTTSGYTTDTISDDRTSRFVLDGCYDIIRKVETTKGGDALLKFGTYSSVLSSQDTDIDEKRRILLVKRANKIASEVTPYLLDKYTDVDSIHYASTNDPVYYKIENVLTLLPAPTGDNGDRFLSIGYANSADFDYSITNYATGVSEIDSFPAEYYDHILVYASIKCLEDLMHNYIEDEEDSELAQLIAQRVDRLKAQYNEMFGAQQQ